MNEKIHEWFTLEGQTFCAACGMKLAGSPQWCRGRSEVGVPITKKAVEIPDVIEVKLPELPLRSEAELAERRWNNEISPRLKDAGFNERHRQRIVDWACTPQQRVFDKCMELCRGNGAIVVLTGERGTGKTTICAQMARHRAEDDRLPPWDRQPPYRKLVDLIAKYKPLYGNMGSVTMDDLAASRDWFCRNHSLVFIDEIHECEDAALKNRVLTDIIDRRYAAHRDTILISNQSVEDFKASTNDSILSRLSEHGSIIPCNWRSWRAKAA